MRLPPIGILILHPGHIALGVLAVLALLLIVFGSAIQGGWRRFRELYRLHFAKASRERQLFAAVSFYMAFAGVRVLTHAIRNGRGPFHNVSVGGRHIHHLVWGILLLLAVGYGWLLRIDAKSRWPGRVMSSLYGIGAALTLDEFALWLNLEDVYWERQGRASIDAVVLFGSLLAIGVLGGRFFHSLAGEAVRGLARRKR